MYRDRLSRSAWGFGGGARLLLLSLLPVDSVSIMTAAQLVSARQKRPSLGMAKQRVNGIGSLSRLFLEKGWGSELKFNDIC
jgi:hypothetical protein